MPGRLLFVVGCLLLIPIAWLLFSEDEGSTAPPADPSASEPGDHATLRGRAAHARRTPRSDDSAASAVRPLEDGRRWFLEVRFVGRKGRAFFGPAWNDEGEVDSAFGGQEVRIELRRGTAHTELARGVLDARGRLRVELPRIADLDPLERAASTLHVFPVGDGLQMAPHPTRVMSFVYKPYSARALRLPGRPPIGDVTLRLIAIAHRGGIVRGRAVRPDDTPVFHAHVHMFGREGAEASDSCTDDDGRFSVWVSKGGTFDVNIVAQDGSSASREPVPLPADRDIDLGTFVLRGEHAYGGRITYPDGSPIEGVPANGRMIWLEGSGSSWGPWLGCDTHGESRATTDADGRYQLYLDIPCPQHLCWRGFGVPGNARVRLESTASSLTDKPGMHYDGVLDGHALRVLTLDPQGRPVAGSEVTFRKIPAPTDAKPDPYENRTTQITTDEAGQATVWMTHGSRWRVTATNEGAAPASQEVTVPAKGNESRLELALLPLDGQTGLEFTLFGPDGRPLAPIVVHLRSEDGLTLFRQRVETAGYILPVAGERTYHVTLRSFEGSNLARGKSQWLKVESTVVAAAGKVTPVALTTNTACHVEVTLRAAKTGKEWRSGPDGRLTLTHEDNGHVVDASIDPPFEGVSTKIVDAELEPGLWSVRLRYPGNPAIVKTVRLERGVLGRVEFFVEEQR